MKIKKVIAYVCSVSVLSANFTYGYGFDNYYNNNRVMAEAGDPIVIPEEDLQPDEETPDVDPYFYIPEYRFDSFRNSWGLNFEMRRYADKTYGEVLGEKYLEKLKESVSETEFELISEKLNDPCKDLSYGMSVTSLLSEYGLFPFYKYTDGAKSFSDLDFSNEELYSLLVYYQMLQYTDDVMYEKSLYSEERYDGEHARIDTMIQMIASAVEHNETMLVNFSDGLNEGITGVVYGAEKGNYTLAIDEFTDVFFDWHIEIYDPSFKVESQSYMHEMYYDSGSGQIAFQELYHNTATDEYTYYLNSGITFNYIIDGRLDRLNKSGYLYRGIDQFSCYGKAGEAAAWKFENGKVVVSGTGLLDTLPIRIGRKKDDCLEVVIENGIEEIGFEAFDGYEGLESIILPESLKSIGGFAFSNCSSLKEIVIPEGTETIGDWAFRYCTCLEKVTIPNGVSVANSAFENCRGLRSAIISDEVTLGMDAFDSCTGLTDVYFPESEIYLIEPVFRNCYELTVHGPINSIAQDYALGWLHRFMPTDEPEPENEDVVSGTCGEGLTWKYEDELLVISGSGEMTDWKTSDFVNPPWIHLKDKIKGVLIGEGVKTIGSYSFEGFTNLKAADVPEGLTRIGECAFRDCTKLEAVLMSEGLTEIGANAFDSCKSLAVMDIPSTVTAIGQNAFLSCLSLKEFKCAEDNSKFSTIDGVLYNKDADSLLWYPLGCKEDSFSVPDTVEKIELTAFYNNENLKSIFIPETVRYISSSSFMCSFWENRALETIYGVEKSQAQYFAKYEGFNFVAAEALPLRPVELNTGDIIEAHAGDEVTVPVYVKNNKEGFSEISFEFTVPEGFNIASGMKIGDIPGDMMLGQNMESMTETADGIVFSSAFLNYTYAFSKDGNALDNGLLCTIPVKIPSDAAPGRYTIDISDFKVLKNDGSEQVKYPEDSSAVSIGIISVLENEAVTTVPETTEPAVTTVEETPAATEISAVTDVPEASEEPAVTTVEETPATTEISAVTDVPETSEEPAVTTVPATEPETTLEITEAVTTVHTTAAVTTAEVTKPETTVSVVTTAEVTNAVTANPVTTAATTITALPVATNPATTNEVTAADVPDTSVKTSETTTVSESSEEPYVTTVVSYITEPENTTVVPETTEPEMTTVVPEITTVPAEPVTSVPEETTVPTEPATAEPDKTTVPTEPATAEPDKTTVPTEPATAEPEKTTVPTEPATAEPEKTTVPTEPATAEPEKTTVPTEPATAEPEKTTVPTEPVTEEPEKTTILTEQVTAEPEKTTVLTEPVTAEPEKTTVPVTKTTEAETTTSATTITARPVITTVTTTAETVPVTTAEMISTTVSVTAVKVSEITTAAATTSVTTTITAAETKPATTTTTTTTTPVTTNVSETTSEPKVTTVTEITSAPEETTVPEETREPAVTEPEQEVLSGTCGNTLEWNFSDGVLSIEGTGDIEDYSASSRHPWSHLEGRIEKVILSEGVTGIGNSAFMNCQALREIDAGGGIARIGSYAFQNCVALERLSFSERLEVIETDAFYNCTNLEQINVSCKTVIKADIPDGVLYSYHKFTDKIISADNLAVEATCDKPAYYYEMCENCGLINDSFIFADGEPLPHSWKASEDAFEHYCENCDTEAQAHVYDKNGKCEICGAEKKKPNIIVRIIEKIRYVGEKLLSGELFVDEESSDSISGTLAYDMNKPLEEGDNTIDWFFEADDENYAAVTGQVVVSAVKVTEPEITEPPVTEPLTDLTSGSITEDISFVIDENGTLIISGRGEMPDYAEAGQAFANTAHFSKVIIGEGISEIGSNTFAGLTDLQSVILPETVRGIGRNAFSGCSSLESIKIPENTFLIYSSAFENCTQLKTVSVPESVSMVGERAFYGCDSLKTVTVYGENTAFEEMSVGYTGEISKPVSGMLIKGRSGSAAYDYAVSNNIAFDEITGNLGSNISYYIDDNAVMYITGEGAIPDYDENSSPFTDRKDIQKVVFGEGITKIGDFLFYQNRSVQEVVFPSTLESIGKSAFSQCNKIAKADIPEGTVEIGIGAFQECLSLESVVLREGLESIGGWAFEKCGSISTVTLPESVKSVGEMAFSKCTGLKEISVPSAMEDIRDIPEGTVITVREAVTEVIDLSGDADGNGVINSKDYICMVESIISGNPPKNKEDADIDKDNIIGVSDLILLRKKLLK